MTSESTANAEQQQYWNEQAGPRWVADQERLDAQIGPIGEHAVAAAELSSGERALDVGCGCGESVLFLAEAVGAGGHVLGVDLSEPMLARARERVRARGLDHVVLEQADAQVHPFEEAAFDVVFSRFGVMFFEDPVAAFANLARSLRPGGRVAFVCWRSLASNPWMRIPLAAAAAHLELGPPPDPRAPGPFAFADAERVLGILERAGLADISSEVLAGELALGGPVSLAESVDFALRIGPLSRLLAEADAALLERVRESVVRAVEPFAGPEGVRMPYEAWLFRARRS